MSSVTQRIKLIKQPRGGYIPPKILNEIKLEDTVDLKPNENVAANLIGLAVDYLTRFMLNSDALESFKISLKGANNLRQTKEAHELLKNVTGIDDLSIISACKMVGYDVAYRAGIFYYVSIDTIQPDLDTINNIRVMVQRSLKFFKDYGPITLDGFTLDGAYTDEITIGDGDFLTNDTLWDFKVSKHIPDIQHTLQLLIYYLMGKRSINTQYFNKIKYLGIYNPRLNKIFRVSIDIIPEGVINSVEEYVIGY